MENEEVMEEKEAKPVAKKAKPPAKKPVAKAAAPTEKKKRTPATPDKPKRVFKAPPGDTRLTLNIDRELHKRLKIAAIKRDTTIGDLIEKWIERTF